MASEQAGPLKNFVIIGGATAGVTTAHALERTCPATHRIVLIDANEFAYWPIGALRGSVKPDFEKEIFASFNNFFGANSRHVVLAGYRVTKLGADSIELNKPAPAPFDGAFTISVDAGVVATGSIYALPMRPMSPKMEECVEKLREMQREVAASQHILIVGGGPVGVEFAGEVKEEHPDKKITLVQQAPALIAGFRAGLGKRLFSQLTAKGVDVRLDTGVELTQELMDLSQKRMPNGKTRAIKLSDGTTVDTDFLFLGTGGKPNVSVVSKDALAAPDKAGVQRIDVDPATLRLRHAELGKRWFAAGDACNTPDSKTSISAEDHGGVVATQMVAQADSNPGLSKKYAAKPSIMSVPIGPRGGATQIAFVVFGEWVTGFIKGKTLFTSDKFGKNYPAGRPLLEAQ